MYHESITRDLSTRDMILLSVLAAAVFTVVAGVALVKRVTARLG